MDSENDTDQKKFFRHYTNITSSGDVNLKRPCAFLDENLCSIEPVKPEVCILYTGEHFVESKYPHNNACPSSVRYEMLEETLIHSLKNWTGYFSIVWDGNEPRTQNSITEAQWNCLWKKFLLSSPSDNERNLFQELNGRTRD